MLKAGYDVKLASGVITAAAPRHPDPALGDDHRLCRGRGQSVVKLYAAAMFPSFFLAFSISLHHRLALINPKIAPKLPDSETGCRCGVVEQFRHLYSRRMLPAFLAATVAPSRPCHHGGWRAARLFGILKSLISCWCAGAGARTCGASGGTS